MWLATVVNGTAGSEPFLGTAEIDLIDGKLGDDRLLGGRGSDALTGGGPVGPSGFESDRDRLSFRRP